MLKKWALPMFLIFLLIVTFFSSLLIISNAQSITITEKKVVYDLPYPGILPDHPLFFIKKWRDRILEFTTREDLRKADLYLLFSDKDVSAAILLSKGAKGKLAAETLDEAETYAVKIPTLLKKSKQQGAGPTSQFVDKLKLSNNKHREVIEELLKTVPQGDQLQIEKAIQLNEKVRSNLESL